MDSIAVIFAGGTGQRMNTRTKPKQFLELHGKPILIYTLEQFQQHEEIDGIVVVMLEEWINYTQKLVQQYQLTKVEEVVSGGSTGQESIYNGLLTVEKLKHGSDAIVLIHDGVRPLIDKKTISKDIECVKRYGTAITVAPAVETIAMKADSGAIGQIIDRSKCQLAKAPQCFYLNDILAAHRNAISEGRKHFIDSASIMQFYGYTLHPVEGGPDNIKITTPNDFYLFRAMIDAKENAQIFG